MLQGDTNAVINTQYGATSKLTNEDVYIGPPSPEDMINVTGGVVHYVVLLDPGTPTKIVTGDSLFILSWGEHTVDPTKPYHVFSASIEGSLDLECIKARIGDLVRRT